MTSCHGTDFCRAMAEWYVYIHSSAHIYFVAYRRAMCVSTRVFSHGTKAVTFKTKSLVRRPRQWKYCLSTCHHWLPASLIEFDWWLADTSVTGKEPARRQPAGSDWVLSGASRQSLGVLNSLDLETRDLDSKDKTKNSRQNCVLKLTSLLFVSATDCIVLMSSSCCLCWRFEL